LTIQKDGSSFIRGIFFSQTMGGAKKPTAAKKDKPAKDAMKIIQNSKVVTVQDLARQTGVKISAANAFLRESANKGTIKRVGGYSGHHLYQVVSS
jgi:small subunit ribosomal protein S25e